MGQLERAWPAGSEYVYPISFILSFNLAVLVLSSDADVRITRSSHFRRHTDR